MKKLILFLFLIIVLIVGAVFAYTTINFSNEKSTDKSTDNSSQPDSVLEDEISGDEISDDEISEDTFIDKTSISYNGWLHTDGSMLLNQHDEEIQLRGISSHGIEWFYDVINYENLKVLKNDWNINVFRIAMYTDSNSTGYVFNPQENMQKVCNIIDMAVQLDMYVIVDWHILNDNDPQIHKENAKTFFNEISKQYSNTPNVIYEICNEPNGNNVTWDGSVKPYAEEIIPIIRNNCENSLIIVGSPVWCQAIDKVADNPLNFKNVVYSCHFYSGSHGSELRSKIDYCIQKNIPIFISECGLTDASGNGAVYFDKFNEWIQYLNSKNISWVYWSFCNKDEASAILLPNYVPTNNSSDSTSENESKQESIDHSLDFNNFLTESGNFIKNIFYSYK